MVQLGLKITTTIFASIAMLCLWSMETNALPQNDLGFKDCFIMGLERQVKCLEFVVPENWDEPSGKQISLHMAVISASGGFSEPDPFILFAGGPGESAGDFGGLVARNFKKINERRDVILLDQRGTGKSTKLACNLSDIPIHEITDEKILETITECRNGYDVDVRHFTTFDAIKDLEYVRELLGVKQFNIWGGSYGTRIGLLYMKLHPEVIRTSILDGVAAPTEQLFANASRDAERAYQLMVKDCETSNDCSVKFPTLRTDFLTFLERLDRSSIEVTYYDPYDMETVTFDMDRRSFVEIIRNTLYSASRTVILPFVLNETFKGNYAPLMALSLDGASMAGDSISMGLMLSVLCAEEIPRTNKVQLADVAAKSFHQDTFFKFFENACTGWPKKNVLDGYADDIRVDIPTLVFSGNLDPVTSPLSAEDSFDMLTNALHFIVSGTGHGASSIACGRTLMKDFIESGLIDGLDGACFDVPIRDAFILGSTGSTP